MSKSDEIVCRECGSDNLNWMRDENYNYCDGKIVTLKYIVTCKDCENEFSVFEDYENDRLIRVEVFRDPNQQ